MALPQTPIETPDPQPVARGRLLDAITELPLPETPGNSGNAWINGVAWTPDVCRPLLMAGVGNICAPSDLTNPGYNCPEPISQTAFQVYDVYNDSILGATGLDLEEMLMRRFRVMQSWAFAKELASAPSSGGMSLSAQAAAQAPAGYSYGSSALAIVEAIGVLEDHLGTKLYGAQGLIHMAPGMLVQAQSSGAVRLVGNQYETPTGHRVVADAGYVAMPPPGGASDAGAHEGFIYASGPVFYRSTSPDPISSEGDTYVINRNRVARWLTSVGLLVFNPCPVSAVLAKYAQAS